MLGPLGLPAFPTWLHLPTLRNLRLRSPALLSWGTGQSSHYRVRREEAGRPQRSRDTGGQPAPWAACLGPLDLSHLAQALMKEQKRGRGRGKEKEGEGRREERGRGEGMGGASSNRPGWGALMGRSGSGPKLQPPWEEGQNTRRSKPRGGGGQGGEAGAGSWAGCPMAGLHSPGPYCVHKEVRFGSHCWSGMEPGPWSRDLPELTPRPPGASVSGLPDRPSAPG